MGHTGLDLKATQGATVNASVVGSLANPLNVQVTGGLLNLNLLGEVNGVSGDVNGIVAPINILTLLNNPTGTVYFNGLQLYPYFANYQQGSFFAFSDALDRQAIPFFENRGVSQVWISDDSSKISTPHLETQFEVESNGETTMTLLYTRSTKHEKSTELPRPDNIIPVNNTTPDDEILQESSIAE